MVAVKGSVNSSFWKEASAHTLGEGLEGGADLSYLRRAVAKVWQVGEHRLAATMRLVAAGGLCGASRASMPRTAFANDVVWGRRMSSTVLMGARQMI